jgi:DNA-binding MarR family transcriptional regulator
MKKREELIEELFESSQAVQRAWKLHFFKVLGEEGFTPPQLGLLFFIKEHQPVTASALATHLQVSRSAASQMLEKLAQAGFISREEDPNDRRLTYIRISASGEKKLKKLEQKRKDFFISTSYGLTDEELINMRLINNKIIEQIENQ